MKNVIKKQKLHDLFHCSVLESRFFCSFVKNYTKILWRLSKKHDFYLYILVSCPNQIFTYNQLYSYKMITLNNDKEYQTTLDFKSLEKDPTHFFVETVDEKTIKDIKSRIEKLHQLVNQALENNKLQNIKKYDAELKMLSKYLNESVRGRNKSSSFNLYKNSIILKKHIRSSIKTSLQKIKDRDFDLYASILKHLKLDKYLVFFLEGYNYENQ